MNCCTFDDAENPPLVLAALIVPDDALEKDVQGNFDDTDDTPSVASANCKQQSLVHVLLQNNANVNFTNREGATALHVACNRGKIRMVNVLLSDNKIKVNVQEEVKNTPLHEACDCGERDIVVSLFEAGADFTLKNHYGMNPLHVAVVQQHLNLVKTILYHVKEERHLLQEKDNDGHSTFLLAVKTGNEKMVKFLLGLKLVNVTDKNNVDSNAFHLAAKNNKKEIMQSLCNHDWETACILMNEKDSVERTPLHCSAQHNQTEALQFLIER